MSSIIEEDIQLLRYHARPYICISLPSCSHLFNFGSPLPLPFECSKLKKRDATAHEKLDDPCQVISYLQHSSVYI